ncbi:hypothetical protein Nepgr_031373 [Nepenthes gracilis]|uniref:Agenet-like domain-containing protein n=1 Tax=Nepenthes gracilis TaxID=150966 RepID=A0AAD3TH93_NEPGR|nr:hypothetical protein Nepgr_031373 [Nepenthes gracilis]
MHGHAKQPKHYPAFCRNGTTIAIQSFVFVMAKEGSAYVAYLEGRYEDKRGQKKVQVLKADEKIELLSQDSCIQGCWFRSIVLEIIRKQVKVPAFRLAAPDKLGVRCPGRSTIQPCPPNTNAADSSYEVRASVDAWWSDEWWEGINCRSKQQCQLTACRFTSQVKTCS